MTEAEWMASNDPAAMMRWLAGPSTPTRVQVGHAGFGLTSDRKLRLFACACCRQVWDGAPCGRCGGERFVWEDYLGGTAGKETRKREVHCPDCHGTGRALGLTDPRSRRAVEAAERYADGEVEYYVTVLPALHQAYAAWNVGTNYLAFLPWAACGKSIEDSLGNNWFAVTRRLGPSFATQAALLRCLFGNPWRPAARRDGGFVHWLVGDDSVTYDPPWLTPTVLAIARSIHDERRPADLGILADALEDAGCPAEVACLGCGGHGCKPFPSRQEFVTCRQCRGTGRMPNPLLAHLRQADVACRECGGEGMQAVHDIGGSVAGNEPCDNCSGTGRVPTPHALPGCHVVDLVLGKEWPCRTG